MIDNPKEVYELIEALKMHLPMRAYATEPLVKAIRQQGDNITIDDPVQVDTVLYLGDEGGIACSIERLGGKSVVLSSITHLRIDRDHPLAGRIQAYQMRRSQLLEQTGARPVGRSSQKLRANLARNSSRRKFASPRRKRQNKMT